MFGLQGLRFMVHGLSGFRVDKVHGAPGPVAALPYRCHLLGVWGLEFRFEGGGFEA